MNIEFDLGTPLHFLWSGKFKSPQEEWVHMTRPLLEYELFLVTEGTLYIASESGRYQVNQEEYLIMPPTKKQYGYQPSACGFYWLHFSLEEEIESKEQPILKQISQRTEEQVVGQLIEQTTERTTERTTGRITGRITGQITERTTERLGTVSEKESIPFQGKVKNMDRLTILVHQLQDVARRYQHQHTMDLLAEGILFELYNQSRGNQTKASATSKMKIYESVLNYVAWNRYQRISVGEMAEYLGYHEKYLSSVFKEQAGITLKQYLLQEVMEYAKAEMVDSQKTIAQIGYSLGYSDPHNFSHSFKSVVGITPKEYRNNCVKPAKIR